MFSSVSWMPSDTLTAAAFVISERRFVSLRLPNRSAKATGTPQRQESASFQLYAKSMTEISAVEI